MQRFDFSGTKLVGTSYNEQLHLWDINPAQPETHSVEGGFLPYHTITHNNMVGRDVTEFKATWSNCPSQPLHFTVGSLTRELDFFKPDGTLLGQLWSPEVVQAPAVTACHPSKSLAKQEGCEISATLITACCRLRSD